MGPWWYRFFSCLSDLPISNDLNNDPEVRDTFGKINHYYGSRCECLQSESDSCITSCIKDMAKEMITTQVLESFRLRLLEDLKQIVLQKTTFDQNERFRAQECRSTAAAWDFAWSIAAPPYKRYNSPAASLAGLCSTATRMTLIQQ